MTRQDRLFGADDPQLDLFSAKASPAPPRHEELTALAARLPENLRFGTSSWTFAGWAGLVYERRYKNRTAFVRDSLAEYATHPLFQTVGIDRGYYAPISEADYRHYAVQLPQGFGCVIKLPQQITSHTFAKHASMGALAGQRNPDFLSAELYRATVGGPIKRAFSGHVAAMLVEIPPTVEASPEDFVAAVTRFLKEAPNEHHFAFEIRNRELLTPAYFAALRDHGASHVFNFYSRMPSILRQLERASGQLGVKTVIRLLLPPNTRYQQLKKAYAPFDRVVAPQPTMRSEVVTLITKALAAESECLVIVNNKAEGSSPLTIEALAKLVAGSAT